MGPDPHLLTIPSVCHSACMFLLYHEHGSIGAIGISFVLKGACLSTLSSMCYHRDPPDDPHHPVYPISEERLADQQEKPPYQSTHICYV